MQLTKKISVLVGMGHVRSICEAGGNISCDECGELGFDEGSGVYYCDGC